jgi:hypothetical protein
MTDTDPANSTPDTSTTDENRLSNCIGLKQAEELTGKCYDSDSMNYKVRNSERARDEVLFPRARRPADKNDGGTSEELQSWDHKSSIQDAINSSLERSRVDLPG